MSLNLPGLKKALTDLASDPPKTPDGCAAKWADAMKTYATSIIPASVGVVGACSTLKASLIPAFSKPNNSTAPTALGLVEKAFLEFGAAVGLGMAGFVPKPPTTPVGFLTLIGTSTSSAKEGAEAVAAKINTWMMTGIAQPPSGPPVVWS